MTGRPGRPTPRSVTIVGSRSALAGLRARLRPHGVTVHRVVVLQPTFVGPGVGALTLKDVGAFDTLVLTSREAILALSQVPRVFAALRAHRRLSVFAAGRGTAATARLSGLPPAWAPAVGGSDAISTRLRRSRPRRILYPRSSRAGPRLAQTLRRQGHTVDDRVAYRLRPAHRLGVLEVDHVLRADRLVVTSPSALSHLRFGMDPVTFRRLRTRPGLIVLGERSARAARGHGFRGIRRAPTTAEQGFTRFLVRELQRDR